MTDQHNVAPPRRVPTSAPCASSVRRITGRAWCYEPLRRRDQRIRAAPVTCHPSSKNSGGARTALPPAAPCCAAATRAGVSDALAEGAR